MDSLEYFKSKLNSEQIKPVLQTEGPVLVFAGAGTGKTRVLTHRIVNLLRYKNVPPSRILAITFTNNAADTMKSRIEKLCPQQGNYVWISTFHKFCLRILRNEYESLEHKFGFKRNFSIADEEESNNIFKKLFKELDFTAIYEKLKLRFAMDKKDVEHMLKGNISRAKSLNMDPDELYKHSYPAETELGMFLIKPTNKLYKEYNKTLLENNLMDFDDILFYCYRLLLEYEHVRNKYQMLYKYIHVDEYQDTNYIQNEIAILLAQKHKNLFAVGDDDQSIYAWRGAEVKNILNFRKRFDNVIEYKLERNYRSTPEILECANACIQYNKDRVDKKLYANKSKKMNAKNKVKFTMFSEDYEEVQAVADKIEFLTKYRGYKYSDFAILYRKNMLAKRFEDMMIRQRYPYVLYGGYKFYHRRPVKIACKFLELLTNPQNEISVLEVINIPKRGIGEKTKERILSIARNKNSSALDVLLNYKKFDFSPKQKKGFSEFKDMYLELKKLYDQNDLSNLASNFMQITRLDEYFDEGDKEERDENLGYIKELMYTLRKFIDDNEGATLSDFLNDVSLSANNDRNPKGSIILSTIHSIKGMERRCVFFVALENTAIPARGDTEFELEEERRLMYVAITRAQEKLYLSGSCYRYIYGSFKESRPSPFVGELGDTIEIEYKCPNNHFNEPRNFNTFKSEDDYTSFKYNVNEKAIANLLCLNRKQQKENNPNDFKVGEYVMHKKFKKGRIIEKMGEENAAIEFEKVGTKILNLRLAPIEKI